MNIITEIFKSNKELSRYILESIKKQFAINKMLNVVISGGSTFDDFLNIIKKEKIFRGLKFFLTDERIVGEQKSLSNTFQIKYKTNNKYKSEIFDEIDINQSMLSIVEKFESRSKEIEKIDNAFVGIGEDGHYASIFKNSYKLCKSKSFEIIKNSHEIYKRITLNEHFFKNVKNLYVVINHPKKNNILTKIYKKNFNSDDKILELLLERSQSKKNFLLVTKNCIDAINK